MEINWVRIFNQLFELINQEGPGYFSGGRYISKVREVIDPYFPDYQQYINSRKQSGRSTSRKDYYYDILMKFGIDERISLLNSIMDDIKDFFPDQIAQIKNGLFDQSGVPKPKLEKETWNSERLNKYLQEIDSRISAKQYDGAVTLVYTSFEGFLKAFIKKKVPDYNDKWEIIALSKAIRIFLKDTVVSYPDEALQMLNHIAHTIDKSRNKFSESHFDEKAQLWLAIFVRDLLNTEIRLLLHFM
jgi:hypothetical protein